MSILPDFGFGLPASGASWYTDPGGDIHHTLTAFSAPTPTTVKTAAVATPDATAATPTADSILSGNVAAAQSGAEAGTEIALQMSEQLNAAAADTFYQNLETAFPGYQDLLSKMTSNVSSSLSGVLPEDVSDLVRMYSAEQGQSGAMANTARNLGLTSLERSDIGFEQGAKLFGLTSEYLTPPTMDVFDTATAFGGQISGESMISPYEAGQLDIQESQLAASIDQFNASLAWDQEVSRMNLAYEQWATQQQQDYLQQALAARSAESEAAISASDELQQALAARRAESEAAISAFDELSSTLQGGSTPASTPTTQNASSTSQASSSPSTQISSFSSNPIDLVGQLYGIDLLGAYGDSDVGDPVDLINELFSVPSLF